MSLLSFCPVHCNGVCDSYLEVNTTDCNTVCDYKESYWSPDCDGTCNTFDSLNSVDCSKSVYSQLNCQELGTLISDNCCQNQDKIINAQFLDSASKITCAIADTISNTLECCNNLD